MTFLLSLALLILGLVGYYLLPVRDMPSMDYPAVSISIAYPGASPEVIEKRISRPLEGELASIDGIDQITSTNNQGSSSIYIRFKTNKNINTALQDTQRAIDRTLFPSDMKNRPTLMVQNASDPSIMYIVLSSEGIKEVELYELAEWVVSKRITQIEGVSNVKVHGSRKAFRIKVDPQTLLYYKISLSDLESIIRANHSYTPIGKFQNEDYIIPMKSDTNLKNVDDLKEIKIKQLSEGYLTLSDVALIEESSVEEDFHFYYRQDQTARTAVVLEVLRQPSSNTLEINQAIQQILPAIKDDLPANTKMDIVYNQAHFISTALYEVVETLILSAALVIIIVFCYLKNIKETIAPAVVIPCSIIITFLFMYMMGYSLNILTLLALTLSIGFVVDDAIVVVENYVRYREMGVTPYKAAIHSSKEISFTLLSITLSLVAVFIPLLFIGDQLGKLFREFSITLCIAVIVSGILSLTLTPVLCTKIATRHSKITNRFLIWFDRSNEFLLIHYKKMLAFVLRYQKVTLMVGVGIFILTVVIAYTLDVHFLPKETSKIITTWVSTDPQFSQPKTEKKLHQIAAEIAKNPEVNFLGYGAVANNGGFMFIGLKESFKGSCEAMISNFTDIANQFTGVSAYMNLMPYIDMSLGEGTKTSDALIVKSFDAQKLCQAAELMTQKMQESPLFSSAYSSKGLQNYEMKLRVDKKAANHFGVLPSAVEQALALAYNPQEIAKIYTTRNEAPIYLQLDRPFAEHHAALHQLYIKNNQSDWIPVRELLIKEDATVESNIEHVDLFPAIYVNFEVAKGVRLNKAIEQIKAWKKELFPDSVTGSFTGVSKIQEKYKYRSIFLMALAIVAMYIILGILYESFIHPITILSTLPFAILGGVLTLKAGNWSFSLYSFIGMILLIGMVKKNGIMLVDFALQKEKEGGMTPEKAIFEACIVRFRPIMMTTLAAIAGALPIAIGIGSQGGVRYTLGLVIIGGLVFSQLLTLLFTPVVFLFFHRFQKKHQDM